MKSLVPTITDGQLEQITQADDIIRSLTLELPHIKCDPSLSERQQKPSRLRLKCLPRQSATQQPGASWT